MHLTIAKLDNNNNREVYTTVTAVYIAASAKQQGRRTYLSKKDFDLKSDLNWVKSNHKSQNFKTI